MTYIIDDNTKEFETENFVILALCDNDNVIHISIDKELNSQIKDKSNLYEMIAESFEAGLYKEIESFKVFCISKKMLNEYQERGIF